MTARELRLHLADKHSVVTRGLSWEDMAAIHAEEHDLPGVVSHQHEDDEP